MYHINDFLADGIYQQDMGSCQYSLDEIKIRLPNYDNPRLADKVDEGLVLIEEAAAKEYAYQTTKDLAQNARRGAAAIDNKIDSLLSSIHDIAESNAELPGDPPAKQTARELLDAVFPTGVYPITSQAFEEQQMLVDQAVDQLMGDLSEHVDELGLGTHVEKLAELNDEFARQLSIADHDPVTFDEVQAARQKAREAYHKVVLIIYADYCDDPEARRDLLEPVAHQQNRIARELQRRGEANPTDPESGEPTSPDDTPTRNDGGDPEEPTDDGNSQETDDDNTTPDDSPEPTDGDNTNPDEPNA